MTGGGTGGNGVGTSATASYKPFNGANLPASVPAGVWPTVVIGVVGALLGAFGVVSRV